MIFVYAFMKCVCMCGRQKTVVLTFHLFLKPSLFISHSSVPRLAVLCASMSTPSSIFWLTLRTIGLQAHATTPILIVSRDVNSGLHGYRVSSWLTELSFLASGRFLIGKAHGHVWQRMPNPVSTQKAEAGRSLNYTPVWITELDPGQPGPHRKRNPFQKTRKGEAQKWCAFIFQSWFKIWWKYCIWNVTHVKLQKSFWMVHEQSSVFCIVHIMLSDHLVVLVVARPLTHVWAGCVLPHIIILRLNSSRGRCRRGLAYVNGKKIS